MLFGWWIFFVHFDWSIYNNTQYTYNSEQKTRTSTQAIHIEILTNRSFVVFLCTRCIRTDAFTFFGGLYFQLFISFAHYSIFSSITTKIASLFFSSTLTYTHFNPKNGIHSCTVSVHVYDQLVHWCEFEFYLYIICLAVFESCECVFNEFDAKW